VTRGTSAGANALPAGRGSRLSRGDAPVGPERLDGVGRKRFKLENPRFLGGLTPGMKQDLERERRFEAHRDDPLETPFEP